MEPINSRYVVFEEGSMSLEKIAPLRWPLSYEAIADLLGIDLKLLRSARHAAGITLPPQRLNYREAMMAWDWICYRSRDPEMLKRIGIERKTIEIKVRSRLEKQEGFDKIKLIPHWPCTHRRLGLYLDVTHPSLTRMAKKLGIDVSTGFSEEAASKVWEKISDDRQLKN
jgi:hypothetical protein